MRMERIAAAVRELSDRHFNLLRTVERFSEKGMLVTARELSSITALSEEYVSRLLTDLTGTVSSGLRGAGLPATS